MKLIPRRTAALTTGLAVVAGSTLLLAAPASAADFQVTPDQLQGSIEPGAYAGWHEGYAADAVGAPAEITDAGLVLTGPSQIINGFTTPIDVDGVETTFADYATTAGYASTNDAVYFQIPIFGDGAEGEFTTLRPLEAGQAGLAGQWVASNSIPGVTADTPYSIDELSAAIGDFRLLAFGVLAIEGGDDVVQTISFNGDDYNFFVPVVEPVFDPLVVVDPDTIFFSQVRPGGAGFSVTVTGFTPGDTLSIAVTDPNGEIFGAADGGNTVIADENGGFVAEGLTLEGEGIQVGTYIFSVTDSEGVREADSIAVIADPVAAGAPVTPTLAETGADSGLLVGGAAALFLLGAAGMLFAAARRKGAQITA